MPDGAEIREMFRRVAPRYDRANRLLSLGVDRAWRRRAVAAAGVLPGERALDVCAGTGDLTLALARAGAAAIGSDFCAEMLQLARDKSRRWRADAANAPAPAYVVADAMALPFSDDFFDVCTVAFGIRNVSDPEAGLREMTRVTRPGGRVVVLEFCKPRAPLIGGAYLFYFRRVLPLLGRWISGDKGGAYRYLPDSVMSFPEREEFTRMMERAGMLHATTTILTGGVAALYCGDVPS